MEKEYEFLKHTADVEFRAYGKTLNSAFANSALAMFKAMHPGKVRSKIRTTIKIKGKDLENLLYNFLEELLFLLDSNDFFLSKAIVKIDKESSSLEAKIFGDLTKEYDISLQVKAVTYNSMIIKKLKGKYVCQVVLDV